MTDKISELAMHELLDRTSIVMGMVDVYLLDHINFNDLPQKTKQEIMQASVSLFTAYQHIGEIHFEGDEK